MPAKHEKAAKDRSIPPSVFQLIQHYLHSDTVPTKIEKNVVPNQDLCSSSISSVKKRSVTLRLSTSRNKEKNYRINIYYNVSINITIF